MKFRELKRLIKPLPAAATPSFEPKTLDVPFTWNQVFNPDLPPKIQELLWRAAFNAQLNKSRLARINPAAFTSECDLCYGKETSSHMYAECVEAKTFMDKVKLLIIGGSTRQRRYLMGIAYQAIWFAHVEARIAGRAISPNTYSSKYRGLLKYYKARTKKYDLRARWPSGKQVAISFPSVG